MKMSLGNASELLAPGETALFVFTRGQHFAVESNGAGHTGNWVINPERPVDWIVVFKDGGGAGADAELWRGRPAGVRGPIEEKRYVLDLADVELVGHTSQNWRTFTGGSANPVRYVTKL